MTWTIREGAAVRAFRGTLVEALAFAARRRAAGVACEVCS